MQWARELDIDLVTVLVSGPNSLQNHDALGQLERQAHAISYRHVSSTTKTPQCHRKSLQHAPHTLLRFTITTLDHPSRTARQQSTRTSGTTAEPLWPGRADAWPTYLIQYRLPPPSDSASRGPDRRYSNSICRMAPIGTNVYLQNSLEPNGALNDACCLCAADMTTSSMHGLELRAFIDINSLDRL